MKIPLFISRDGAHCDNCMFQSDITQQIKKHGIKEVGCILFNDKIEVDEHYNPLACSTCFNFGD